MSCLARWGRTTAAASVPATTTVWCSRAEPIWAAQVACRLHPCFLSLASILALPARFRSAGAVPGGDDLQDGVVRPARAPPRSRGLGGVWVNGWPRMRPLVWLTWRARSRSKPVSMLSAAVSSSEVLMACRVWGMVLAAWAMTAASLASVLALPGVRSAMRLIDSPGR